ncbi:MAG: UDP-N-acetylmuramoyl-L-alanyl-D-glutamate--2,6-diaminopimelate ligase [Vibrio sp.]|uniref:UDP-N-acetylmuramoyl-L-alanyl-D-glutamate--2, 6-diaminopimelate ligase n=1 Tax=Vibrio sp. TaxID=678 RepID=UPI003A86952B
MNTSKALSELISPWLQADPAWGNISVTRLDLDSRKIQHGDTFVAIVGHAVDGRKYIDTAIEHGANAVLAQACQMKTHGCVEWKGDIPVIYIEKLDQHLSQLAGNLYGAHQSRLVAVTGTNGKTTITQLIAQWIDLLGQKAAVMGTTGNGFLAHLAPAANTTGSAIEIQAQLHQLAGQGAAFTALEVSSHGLVQGRVKKLTFDVGVFSNLSRDHLDYHGTMEEYAKAKFSLFTEHQCKNAIINIDDRVGLEWSSKLPHAVGISLKSKPKTERALWATQVTYAETGITLSFDGSWGNGELHVPLIGEFNASNVMQAFTSMLCLGFAKQKLIETAPQLKPVLGRMELFQVANKAKVVVDYAHTPDALEKALLALRVHCSGKLWAIVGCGGDRDKGKRPMMASIAEKFADRVILTDDNPRSEDPAAIVQDMLAGLTHPDTAQIEHSRYLAAKFAVDNASADDIILLAGKGHEDYQVMAHETIHYSDRESAQTLLGLAS